MAHKLERDGFGVVLKFADDTAVTQRHAGFKTKKEANVGRDEVVVQIHHGTYIVYGKRKAADFICDVNGIKAWWNQWVKIQ